MPVAAAEATNGTKIAVRYSPMNRMRRFSATARASPSSRDAGTNRTVYSRVCTAAASALASVARSW